MTEMTTAPAATRVMPVGDDSDLPHIIIVGGGAGGLELATRLGDKLGRKKKAKISLIERARTHVWKPLLHEIAAGSMDTARHELEYQAQGYWHGFQFRYGEMTGIDRKKQLVYLAATYDEDGRQITPMRSFRYDTLVIAIGCVGNDFGTPGVNEYAIMLDTPEEAERFNRRLINACVRAYAQPEPIRPGQLDVAIIGAGATGTELAAELHQTTRGVVAFGLDKIDPEKDIKITLIEAAPRILPALPERISDAVTETLRKLHVEIRTGSPGDGGDGRGCESRGRQLHPIGARRLGRRRQRTGGAGKARRPRGQPLKSARRHRHAADDARSQHFRLRRLRLPRAEGGERTHSAARAGGASGSLAPLHRDPAEDARRAAAAVQVSRFRLARVAR